MSDASLSDASLSDASLSDIALLLPCSERDERSIRPPRWRAT
ncbi:hypothetical protein [Nocardia callitridis]